MDAQQLVDISTFPCAVVGRGSDFLLIRLDGTEDITPQIQAGRAKGFGFAGVMGMVNGAAAARREPGLDAMRVMAAASLGYARMVVDELKARQCDDSLEWLEDLYALPDTRTEL